MNINGLQNVNNSIRFNQISFNGSDYSKNSYVRANTQYGPDSFNVNGKNKNQNPVSAIYEKFLTSFKPMAALERLVNEKSVEAMIQSNPEIANTLKEVGLKPVVSLENLKEIMKSHVLTTKDFAMGIADELSLSSEDKSIIGQGAMYHDVGKVLIPKEILFKNGKLDENERKIVDLHSRLGYEMLKTKNLDSRVLSIVANHHAPAWKTNDYRAKIVSTADIYSALTEERAYKKPMSSEEAFKIMDGLVESKKIDGNILDALKRYINSKDKKAA